MGMEQFCTLSMVVVSQICINDKIAKNHTHTQKQVKLVRSE